MDKLKWYYNRLLLMSPSEVLWRVRSIAEQKLDDARIRANRLPDAGSLNLESKSGFNAPTPSLDLLTNNIGAEALAASRTKAELAQQHKLSFFCFESLDIGNPPNWHYDWYNKVQAPVTLSSKIDYREMQNAGDCKHVWEPNRHHQFVVMARSAALTGDVEMAGAVLDQMSHWISTNPYGHGMNWRSPLELGVRMINWSWALSLIESLLPKFDERLAGIRYSLYLHAWDVARKFSQGSSANNHLVGEAAGVFVAGAYLPELIPTQWTRSAQIILEEQISSQTSAAGATLEQAFSYQLFVMQLYVVCELVGEWSAQPMSVEYQRQLNAMFDYTREIAALGSQPPLYGDQDDGYVLDLGDHQHSLSAWLEVDAVRPGRDPGEFASFQHESVFWLARPEQLEANQAALQQESASAVAPRRMFTDPQAGIVLMRDERFGVLFDVGPLGYGALAAHGHADALQVVVNLRGAPLLIDPGTYDYYSHPQWRDYFRSTQAHNTLCIDDKNQSELLGRFMWGAKADAELISAVQDDNRMLATGSIQGLWDQPRELCHERSVTLDHAGSCLLIRDQVRSPRRHDLALNFHFAPGVEVEQINPQLFQATVAGQQVQLTLPDGFTGRINTDSDVGWSSRAYHVKESCVCVTAEATDMAGTTFETRLG